MSVALEQPVTVGKYAAFRGPLWRLVTPSWLASAAVHFSLLLTLAFYTFAAPEATREPITVTARDANEAVTIQEVRVELTKDLQAMTSSSSAAAKPPAGELDGVLLPALYPPRTVRKSSLLAEALDDLATIARRGDRGSRKEEGGQNGNSQQQTGALGSGAGDGYGDYEATFFGVKAKGRRFVYLVDNSASMRNGKFETARVELIRSVNQLDPRQAFFVIFFSDTAYPMFHPYRADEMAPATEENKRRLEYWLKTVERCAFTRGREAMRLAFALNPDAIYVLGDGAFTDDTAERLMALPQRSPTIHTMGFGMKPLAERGLRLIASKFRGVFAEVRVSPAMVELSRQIKRPRNRRRNGAWGVTLDGRGG